jgi:hypothetical protein
MGKPLVLSIHPHSVEGAFNDIGIGSSNQLQRKENVFKGRERRQKIEKLENESNAQAS